MEKSRETVNNPQNKNSVFTEEVQLLTKKQYFLNSILETGLKIALWILDLVVSIFLSLGHFFLMVGVGIYKGALSVVNFFKRKVHQFKYNDVWGRISFGVFGISNIKNKQYVNGILYILFEIAYIALFVIFGIPALVKLPTLGPAGQQCIEGCGTMFEETAVVGNSILILIFGLLWILSIFAFLFVWNKSINAGYNLYRIKHFITFDKISKESVEFSESISQKIINDAYPNNKSQRQFKIENQKEIENYLSNIQIDESNAVDVKHRVNYTKYLINLTIKDAYSYCAKRAKLSKKIDELTSKKDAYSEARAAKFAALESDPSFNEIKRARFTNATLSNISKKELKISKTFRNRTDLDKRYSCSSDRQNTINNSKYGKYNDYFKYIAEIDNEVLFWTNYQKFVDIYNESLSHSDEQNEKNRVQAEELAISSREKISSINSKFEAIIEKRAKLEDELLYIKQKYNERVFEVKSQNGDQNELLEAKAILVEETTRINRILNDLPNSKNVSLMKKEEIKEVRHAYNRDRRYLKTNFTPQAYAKQCVIDNMLLEYKIEYALARKFAEIIHNNISKSIEVNSNANVEALKEKKDSYIKANPSKYVGKPLTFIEQLKGLLNQNFHITILLLPLLGIGLFTIVPLIFSVLIAFTNYSSQNLPHVSGFIWNGFARYLDF